MAIIFALYFAICSLRILEITEVILQFLLALLENLKVQVGPAVTEQIIQRLLNIFTREQLTETILHESSAGARAVEMFLKILQLLVQEPATSFKSFLPSIISLCMDQLYPILSDVRIDVCANAYVGLFVLDQLYPILSDVRTDVYVCA